MRAKEDVERVYFDDENETSMSKDEPEGVAQLADLPVADEQAYETKGGAGARISKIVIDNNQSTSSY